MNDSRNIGARAGDPFRAQRIRAIERRAKRGFVASRIESGARLIRALHPRAARLLGDPVAVPPCQNLAIRAARGLETIAQLGWARGINFASRGAKRSTFSLGSRRDLTKTRAAVFEFPLGMAGELVVDNAPTRLGDIVVTATRPARTLILHEQPFVATERKQG